MSDAVIIALIGSSSTTLGIIVVAYLNSRQNKVISNKVDDYHKEVNGKMGQLLETTEALGKKQGAEDNQAETDAKPQSQK